MGFLVVVVVVVVVDVVFTVVEEDDDDVDEAANDVAGDSCKVAKSGKHYANSLPGTTRNISHAKNQFFIPALNLSGGMRRLVKATGEYSLLLRETLLLWPALPSLLPAGCVSANTLRCQHTPQRRDATRCDEPRSNKSSIFEQTIKCPPRQGVRDGADRGVNDLVAGFLAGSFVSLSTSMDHT